MVSTDEASRQSLYADIMKIVHDEAVFIPITNGRVTIVAPGEYAMKSDSGDVKYE